MVNVNGEISPLLCRHLDSLLLPLDWLSSLLWRNESGEMPRIGVRDARSFRAMKVPAYVILFALLCRSSFIHLTF